jgi:hypothetical protein
MANSEAISGVNSYVLYGEETTYNTAVAVTKHLGLVTSFKSSIANNLVENRGFVGSTTGGRDIVSYSPGKLDISGSIDFNVQNWAFMEYVLGAVSGGDPYTYTGANIPPSITIAHNTDNPGAASTDLEETYSGTVIESATIKTSVGEPVTCSLEFKSSKVVIDTTLSSAVALSSEDVYNFTGGSIALPSGSPLSNIIDSVDVSIKNNQEILYGVGSRLGVNALPKERNYSIKISLKYLDNDLITAALGATTPTATGTPTEYATLVLTFASGDRSMTMTFSGVPISDFAKAAELNEVIGEDITLTAKTLSAVEDNT